VEQVVRVVTVFWAAMALLPRGVEYAASGATFGAFTGGCGGLLVLVLVYWWFEHQMRMSYAYRDLRGGTRKIVIFKRLLFYAVPVSAGSLVLPLVQTIDTVIIPHQLRLAGFTVHAATSLFGQFSGMACTLAFLPAVLSVSLSSTLVPHVASAQAVGNRQEINRRISSAMRLTLLFSLPAAVGLAVLAAPIMDLVFADRGAGPVMAWLAPAALFSGLQQTTSGALQGLGNTWMPVGNLLAGCALKVICNYFLVANPALGVKGAAIGSVACFTLSYLLNCWALYRRSGYTGSLSALFRPLLAATIMGAALTVIYRLLSAAGNLTATCISVLLGVVIYFAVLLACGELRLSELKHLFRL
jgi:stage V sporulation protein B